jgi:AcrR family transcriptional regulator
MVAKPTAEQPRALRSDARRNRERITAVAAEVFGERGVNASLEDIAQRSAVGIGTLYRHFPTRQTLVEAIFQDKIEDLLRAAEQAATDPDAWNGFAAFLEHALQAQAANRGLKDVFTEYLPPSGTMADARTRVRRQIKQLLTRAQKQGSVRPDLAISDITMLFWATSRIIEATSEIAPNAWRRHLALALDAYRATGRPRLPARPLTEAQLEQAAQQLRAPSTPHTHQTVPAHR